jgi:hypothetical protein
MLENVAYLRVAISLAVDQSSRYATKEMIDGIEVECAERERARCRVMFEAYPCGTKVH